MLLSEVIAASAAKVETERVETENIAKIEKRQPFSSIVPSKRQTNEVH
jgi:hypothetical protein